MIQIATISSTITLVDNISNKLTTIQNNVNSVADALQSLDSDFSTIQKNADNFFRGIRSSVIVKQRVKRLKIKLQELDYLRELSTSIRSAKWVEDKVQTSHSGEAHFVSSLSKIDEIEKVIDHEMTRMLDLRMEIREVINRVPDPICVLVLQHRYID